jgi:transcriptional regulator with XRE-family HTH domain
MFNSPTINEINATLRAIRRSQSLSLADVEALSHGSIKAVVLGSYERGARSLSVKRALQIAAIYRVPISEILGEGVPSSDSLPPRAILDLRLISARASEDGGPQFEKYEVLLRLLQRILRARQDWNGQVISLRHSDLTTLALVLGEDESDVAKWLQDEKLLLKIT